RALRDPHRRAHRRHPRPQGRGAGKSSCQGREAGAARGRGEGPCRAALPAEGRAQRQAGSRAARPPPRRGTVAPAARPPSGRGAVPPPAPAESAAEQRSAAAGQRSLSADRGGSAPPGRSHDEASRGKGGADPLRVLAHPLQPVPPVRAASVAVATSPPPLSKKERGLKRLGRKRQAYVPAVLPQIPVRRKSMAAMISKRYFSTRVTGTPNSLLGIPAI